MALTSLLESKNANTNFFWKVMGYRIYKTHTRFPKYLLSSPYLSILVVSIVLTVSTAFFLFIVTKVEVAKTNTSFITLLGF